MKKGIEMETQSREPQEYIVTQVGTFRLHSYHILGVPDLLVPIVVPLVKQ